MWFIDLHEIPKSWTENSIFSLIFFLNLKKKNNQTHHLRTDEYSIAVLMNKSRPFILFLIKSWLKLSPNIRLLGNLIFKSGSTRFNYKKKIFLLNKSILHLIDILTSWYNLSNSLYRLSTFHSWFASFTSNLKIFQICKKKWWNSYSIKSK